MKTRFFLFILIVCGCVSLSSYADEPAAPSSPDKSEKAFSSEAPAEAPAQKDAEKIEQNVQATKEIIEQKEKAVEQVKQEADQALAEKKSVEEEAKLKEEAAAVAKQEAGVLRREAAIRKDSDLLKRAKELEKEAQKLEKEAKIYSDKLNLAQSKAEIALQEIAAKQGRIDSLHKTLETLQREKTERTPMLEKIGSSVMIVVIALILFLIMKISLRYFELFVRKNPRTQDREIALRIKTFVKILYSIGYIGIGIISVFSILETFGVSVAPLLAGAGIVGLAFGFGGQYLIRDVISGFFIVAEGQYRIDDVVKIGEFSGLVEDINLRITTLRDLEGRVIIIPNGEIKSVINYTKEYAHALFDIGIAYKEDVDRVIKVITELGREIRKDERFGPLILADLEMFGVDQFAESAVIIKFRIKTLPIKQWDVMREFNRRLKKRFDELGISIPFPQMRVHLESLSKNTSFDENAYVRTRPPKKS